MFHSHCAPPGCLGDVFALPLSNAAQVGRQNNNKLMRVIVPHFFLCKKCFLCSCEWGPQEKALWCIVSSCRRLISSEVSYCFVPPRKFPRPSLIDRSPLASLVNYWQMADKARFDHLSVNTIKFHLFRRPAPIAYFSRLKSDATALLRGAGVSSQSFSFFVLGWCGAHLSRQ